MGLVGADRLTGLGGNDVFRYTAVNDTNAQGYDYITDFQGPGAATGDVIDLAAIDADADIAGDQPFAFNHTGPLGAGTIRVADNAWGPHTMVQGLTKTGQYFHIWILDATTAQASDYAAADFVL